jgi:uncharacterized protein (DUF302 family)
MHGVFTKSRPSSVDETVPRLEPEIERRGLRLFAVIDDSAGAAAHWLELRDTKLVVYGNPPQGAGDAGQSTRSTRSASQGPRLG